MTKKYLILALILGLTSLFGLHAATITSSPTKNDFCLNSWSSIGNIVITENANNDIGYSGTGTDIKYLFITAPAGFEFNPGSGNVWKSGNDISAISFLFRTSGVFAISYSVGAVADNNTITIADLQLRATELASGTVQIGTGSSSINGLWTGITLATVGTAISDINFPAVTSRCSYAGAFSLGATHTLRGGVTLFSQPYTSSPVGGAITGSNFSPSAAGSGTHTVTYTVNTSGGCAFTAIRTVDINAAPVVTMTVTETSGANNNDSRICQGDAVTFTANGASSYRFIRQAGTVQLSTASPYTTTSLNSGDVIYAEGTASNGCVRNSGNQAITVDPLPANPVFNPSNAVFANTDPGFWLDTLGAPGEEANRTVGSPSYFTSNNPGVVFQGGRYFFYPQVAGTGNHIITYHYVDPTTRCESTTDKGIQVGSSGTAGGSIEDLNVKYCTDDEEDTIYVDFCQSCLFYCSYYNGMEFSPDGGSSWMMLSPVSADYQGYCLLGSGSTYRYTYIISPSSLGGAGIKLFRYVYQSNTGSMTYSPTQSTIVYEKPNVTITNTFNTVNCSSRPNTQLTYFANGASGTGVFSSSTPDFVQFNTGDSRYYVHWNEGTITVDSTSRTIDLEFTDNVSGCVNSTSVEVKVALKPSPIIFTPPPAYCQSDFVTAAINGISNEATVQWIKDNPANTPSFVDSYNPANFSSTVYSRGMLMTSETYYLKQYLYAGCESDPSLPYNMTINNPVRVYIGQYNTVCSNQQISLDKLQKTGPVVSHTWSAITGIPGIFNDNTSNSPTYTLSTDDIARGYVNFRVLTADPDGIGQGCPAVSKDTTVYISELPVITVTSSQPVYCSDNAITLSASANKSSALPITWYKGSIAGGDQTGILAPNNITTSFTLSASEKAGGNITFNVESSDPDGPAGPCSSTSSSVTIQINPEAIVEAGADIYSCGDDPIPLSGSCIRIGGTNNLNGYWTNNSTWSTSFLGNANPKVATYNPTPAEATSGQSFLYTLVSEDPDGAGPCTYKTAVKKVTINPKAYIVAMPDYTVCSDGIVNLNSTPSGVSSLTFNWYKNTIQTGIVSPTSANTTYNLSPGEKVGGPISFRIETSDPDGSGPTGPCSAVSADVVVTINPEAVVEAGTPIYTCGAAAVPLSGTCTRIGGLDLAATWSKGAWSENIAANTNPKNFNYIPTVLEAENGGAYTYTLTSADPDGPAGPCVAVAKTVTHTINRAPFVYAGANTTYCSNTIPDLMAERSGSASFITWTKSAGSGTIGSIFSDTTIYNVHPGDYASGVPLTIDFTATTNDPDGTGPTGPCVPATSVVQITINPHLTVNAGSDITVCANQPVNLNGNVKIGGSDRTAPGVNTWKTFDGLGTFTPVGPSNFTGTYNPSGVLTSSGIVAQGTGELGLGDTLFAYLVSADPDGAGPCKADSQNVRIIINPLPIPHFLSTMSTEYCISGNPITLQGNLGSTFSPTGASATFSGGTYVTPVGFEYEFDPKKTQPLNINGGNYQIRYTFKDNHNCSNYSDTTVNVFPVPVVSFTTSSRCQYDTITFTETATVSSLVFPSTEIDWDWYIDGDTVVNVLPPTVYSLNTPVTQYAFSNYGNHNISLRVTSNSGGVLNCTTRKDTTLIFGPYPVVDYEWSRPCSVDSVVFLNKTTIPMGYANSILWNMNGTGAYKNATSAVMLHPQYKFDQPDVYDVELVATTNIYNCESSVTKEVYVVPTYSVTPSNPYDSSFSSGNLKWAPSGSSINGESYSWEWGTPAGKTVINPGKNLWITKLAGNYNRGESSELNSPCFNFKTLDKPMLAMKMWANTRNLAGAVVEATYGNNQQWVTIGQIGEGLDWYNTAGIVGLIGNSPSNPIAQGFSGELLDWNVAKIGLSEYANQDSLVRFRVVFGSADVNDALNQRDGIALDSIWIGNRSKTVLVEHFTNAMSSACIEANDTINSFQSRRQGDMVSIHYHTSFPGSDNMNLKNPVDPSARVLYYGISKSPRTQIDGISHYEQYGNSPSAVKLNSIDTKALENAKFALDISSKKTGMNLEVKAQLIAKEAFSQDVVLNVAVLEKYVSGAVVGGNQSGYQWVLKKMLPDAAGNYISRTWAAGDTVKMPYNWDFVVGDFYDTAQVEVVAFVQNYITKEVYQAARVSSNGNTGMPVITAVDIQHLEENLLIYPVPADDEINVLFGSDLRKDLPYTLSDDLGRIVEKGIVEKGTRMLSFNSKNLAAGMYYLSITKEDGSSLHKKIIVLH